MGTDESRAKNVRGAAGQYFVAGELSRRGHAAVVTTGNCPNIDILCSNLQASRSVAIQVKTFVAGTATCTVTGKAERRFARNFFWILAGIPVAGSSEPHRYFIIPADEMAKNVRAKFELWRDTPGAKGQARDPNSTFRSVAVLPGRADYLWYPKEFEDRWELIEQALADGDASESDDLPFEDES